MPTFPHGHRLRRTLVGLTLLVPVALVACSSSGEDDAETTTTEVATTEAPTTEETTDAEDPADPTAEVIDAEWDGDPQELRGRDGEQFTYRCASDGEPATIWGVETYTDDSSICTAAVQLGLITFDDGGDVTIEIAPGLDGYEGGVANEVESLPYGGWGGSFTFPEVEPGSVEFTAGAGSWRLTARDGALEPGDTLDVSCSPDGEVGSVWGSDPFTADSSICTAAVHAGLITVADGGEVRIEVTDGEETYEGTEANGVTSTDYGSYGKSFTFTSTSPGG
jgi:hypothetical protein